MHVFTILLHTEILFTFLINLNSVFGERYRNQYASSEDMQPMIVSDDGFQSRVANPYGYQRFFYSPYGDVRPQHIRLYDNRFRRPDMAFQKGSYMNPASLDKRQSTNRRRSANYYKQVQQMVPMREDEVYYMPEAAERVERSQMLPSEKQAEETDSVEDSHEDESSRYNDERYPSLLANFKIGNKFDKKSLTAIKLKRDSVPGETAAAKSTDSNTFEDIEMDEKVADELREILDYMGLIDDDSVNNVIEEKEKRESKRADAEDENLEGGSNKIEMVKDVQPEIAVNSPDRNKRNEQEKQDKEKREQNNKKETKKKREEESDISQALNACDSILSTENKVSTEEPISAASDSSSKSKRSDMLSSKSKREETSNSQKREASPNSNTAEKSAEKSEEKDVSSPKHAESYVAKSKREESSTDGSPVAAATTQTITETASKISDGKRSAQLTASVDTSEDEQGGSEYERRVERQIQSRINALKEEVKRELASLKAQEAAQAVHNLQEDAQRKKRQTASSLTLLDEESADLDPALHSAETDLRPHVRKRRGTYSYDPSAVQRYRDTADDATDYIDLGLDDGEQEEAEDEGPNDGFYDMLRQRLRRKRQEGDLSAFHGGGGQTAVVRARRGRTRRADNLLKGRPQHLSDMADTDLFGALPQGYSGELGRFKRVKRRNNAAPGRKRS